MQECHLEEKIGIKVRKMQKPDSSQMSESLLCVNKNEEWNHCLLISCTGFFYSKFEFTFHQLITFRHLICDIHIIGPYRVRVS